MPYVLWHLSAIIDECLSIGFNVNQLINIILSISEKENENETEKNYEYFKNHCEIYSNELQGDEKLKDPTFYSIEYDDAKDKIQQLRLIHNETKKRAFDEINEMNELHKILEKVRYCQTLIYF